MTMGFSTVFIITLTAVVLSAGQPVHDEDVHDSYKDHNTDYLTTKFLSFFDAVSKLFAHTRDQLTNTREKREAMEVIPVFDVNSTMSNETSFEFYEKQYLINKTMALLEQYIGAYHYTENSSAHGPGGSATSGNSTTDVVRPSAQPHAGEWTPDQGRVDPILQRKLSELENLDINELLYVFEHVHQTQKEDTDVTDKSIASLCCNYG